MPSAPINPLVNSLTQPPIPLVKGWSSSYTGHQGPLIDLSQAVPDFRPHPDLLQWLGESASDPALLGYGVVQGEPVLREAYAAHLSARYGGEIAAININIHITAGCNQAFIASIISIASHGDNILMCDPYYFNHETTLSMLGINVRYARCLAESGFVPSPHDFALLIDENTRAIVLTTPNNPTGAIYSPELLEAFADLCCERGIWLLLDETYRDFLPEAKLQPHTLFERVDWSENVIQLFSFSKSFCIPGHRLGAICASEFMVSQVAKVMDNIQICPPRPVQAAVAKALPALQDWREENRRTIQARAEALQAQTPHMQGWDIVAVGAYFAFVRHPFSADPVAVAQAMAEQCGVLCMPGVFFGDDNASFLRFAFANVDAKALQQLPQRLLELKL